MRQFLVSGNRPVRDVWFTIGGMPVVVSRVAAVAAVLGLLVAIIGGAVDSRLRIVVVLSLMLVSVLVHELGHAAVMNRLGRRVKRVQVDFGGGFTQYWPGRYSNAEMFAAAMGGPLANAVELVLWLGVGALLAWPSFAVVGVFVATVGVLQLWPRGDSDGAWVFMWDGSMAGDVDVSGLGELSGRTLRAFLGEKSSRGVSLQWPAWPVVRGGSIEVRQ